MDVRFPNGTIIRNVPEGTTKADLVGKLKAKGVDVAALVTVADPTANLSPVDGMSTVDKLRAGFGGALMGMKQGAEQIFGNVSDQEVADTRRRDAPLMESTAAKIGNVAGYIAPAMVAGFIPGANTYAGAGLVGALTGAAQPTVGDESRLANTAIGAAGGIAGQAVGNKLSQWGTNKIASMKGQKAMQQAQNAPRDAALKAGQAEGYVVPPTSVNPSTANRMIEGLAGKLTTQQQASIRNQEVTNKLARRALGLADDAPITPDALKSIRDSAGKAYEAVKNAGDYPLDNQFINDLSAVQAKFGGVGDRFKSIDVPEVKQLVDEFSAQDFTGPEMVETLKQLRTQATENLKAGLVAPARKTLGKAQKEVADAMDGLIERTLTNAGAGDLAKVHRAARQQIAKTYTVEKALNPASGNVRARKLAAELEKGKPISGDLKTIAQFAAQLPKAADEVTTSMPGVSPLDYATGAMVSAGTGNMAGMLAPLTRPLARGLLLSRPYQSAMTSPDYSVGLLNQVLPLALKSKAGRALIKGGATAGLLGNLPQ